ncbi:MAG: class I tRNA ligase family protein [Lachnospiraceae bacterium]|nr:class I tRNA ligase family protein [Lachnospiraceae bacterium]
MVFYNHRLIERKWKDSEDRIIPGGRRSYPEELLKCYGYDVMSVWSSLHSDADPDDDELEGIFRFLNRVFTVYTDRCGEAAAAGEIENDAGDTMVYDILTASRQVPVLMKYSRQPEIFGRRVLEKYTVMLSPYAPFMCQEMWSGLGHSGFVSGEEKPGYDRSRVIAEIPVEVNGRYRATIRVPLDSPEEAVLEEALRTLGVSGAEDIEEHFFVRNRVINIITKVTEQ